MPQTALPAIHITTKTRIVVEADHALAADLARYGDFYAHLHKARVSDADLVREMARRFMATDRDFQRFCRQPARGRRPRQNRQPAAEQLSFPAPTQAAP